MERAGTAQKPQADPGEGTTVLAPDESSSKPSKNNKKQILVNQWLEEERRKQDGPQNPMYNGEEINQIRNSTKDMEQILRPWLSYYPENLWEKAHSSRT